MINGPLEFNVIQFSHNKFTGEILPELEALRAQEIIRLIDLVFVSKGADGTVTSMEASDLTGEDADKYGAIVAEMLGMLAPEDIDEAAGYLAPDSSAAILLFEHTWVRKLREAISRAGGVLVTQSMVPADTLEEVAEELAGIR